MRSALLAACCLAIAVPSFAQLQTPEPQFEVVSIKRVDEERQGGGMRTEPDGTFMMMNQPLGSLVNVASPVQVQLRDIVGMPDWMMRDRYDVTVRPPAGHGAERSQTRTGLEALHARLHAASRCRDTAAAKRFSPNRQGGPENPTDDAPDFFTALQEQLGLKLERQKTMTPVFVIDHIERPTEN